MHATHELRRVRARRTLITVVAASLLAVSAFAGNATAATPNWSVGYGTDWDGPVLNSGASSAGVSAGSEVGFFEWLHNGGTSNISQLFVTATTTPTATVAGAFWTIQDASDVVVRTGACPVATPLVCSFGALNAGHTVYVVAAFTTGSNLADDTVQRVTFNFTTTGTPPGKNKSHGDAKALSDSVLITKNRDAAGDFNIDAQSITVADDQKITGQNRQATSATVSGSFTGVSVGDSPNLTTPCDGSLTVGFPDWFSCSLLTSLTSVIEVGNGKVFTNDSGGPGIKVLISFSQSPNQLSGDNPFVYHYWTTLELVGNSTVTVPHAELITDLCEYDSGSLPTNATPCLTVGNKNVTVWVFHNGPMRM
ncbi:MAG: hypothetical protein WEE50_07100 [Chloroflexota bacterium]